ncbi:Pseudouridine-5-phosphate glycosidase [Sesbania bispinosa]|nr:Pseudouridine-5-phosphate glycosidase [Sesbania bispinosa]
MVCPLKVHAVTDYPVSLKQLQLLQGPMVVCLCRQKRFPTGFMKKKTKSREYLVEKPIRFKKAILGRWKVEKGAMA